MTASPAAGFSFRPARQQGFTLFELLMVIFVIGVMVGLTVISLGGNVEREFRKDISRLQQVMVNAAEEAPYAGIELGFWVAADGSSYSYYRFDDKKLEWLPYEAEGFMPYTMPAGYRIELELLGDPVDLAALYKEVYKLDDKLDEPDEPPVIPWLVFFSTGDYTPFRLWVTHPQVPAFVYVLEGDGLGLVSFRKVEANQKPVIKREKD